MPDETFEPQTTTQEADIPDADLKKPEPIQLSAPVLVERDVRRYIRKDGVFKKDIERLFDVTVTNPDGTPKKDGQGNIIRKATKTKKQAEAIVIEMCERSGRKIEIDPVSKRYKAVPGHSLSIRVPGFERSEANATSAPEGQAQQEINANAVAQLQKDNTALGKQVAELTKQLTGGADAIPPSFEEMSNKELEAYAEENDISLAGCTNKALKVQSILLAEAERKQ